MAIIGDDKATLQYIKILVLEVNARNLIKVIMRKKRDSIKPILAICMAKITSFV